MNFTEIKELLDQGFTPAQITELTKQPKSETKDAENQKSAQDPAQDPADGLTTKNQFSPEMINSLNAAIKELTHTIQANALLSDQQPERNNAAAVDDMLAAIINPPERKSK